MTEPRGGVLEQHSLTPATIEALADGFGGTTAIAELWRAQESRRLLMVRLAHDHLPPVNERQEALAVVLEAEATAPHHVRGLLADPMVALWAARVVRRALRSADVPPADEARLGEIAAAAALRAGCGAETTGWAREGWVSLPTIGRIRTDRPTGQVRLVVAGDRLTVDGVPHALDDTGWQRARSLPGADGQVIRLEDVDPFRDTFHVPAADRLDQPDFDTWRHAWDAAWQILTRHAPQRVAELSVGLDSLVPLRKPTNRAAHSATAREAIGVIGMDLPDRAADFAVTLVHEFQHSKLSGVLDIVDLYRPSDRVFFAPWRTDARPIGGLFQGVYAFIGVADTWRALSAEPGAFPQAAREFAEARALVSDALDTLAGSGLLTATGERFVAGMRGAVERLHASRVSPEAEGAAQRVLADRRAAWKVTNAAAG